MTTVTIRENQDAPFYVFINNLIEDPGSMGMLRNAPGFLDHQYNVSEDGLTLTRATSWETEESYYNFLYMWLDQHPSYVIDYSTYNTQNNHNHSVTYETI